MQLWIQWEYYRWSQTSTNMTVIIFDCKPEEVSVQLTHDVFVHDRLY